MPDATANPNDFEIFVPFLPLTKDDIEKRQVWGWASIEEPDRADEIMDYASSKPYFSKWSEAAKARTNGKSQGNIREMHGPTAAGKAIHFEASDVQKGFYLGSQVDDDQSWRKVLSGTLSGYSVGGKYVRRWLDNTTGQGLMRYTADPTEISLVDVPAVPHAVYTLVKRDGTGSLQKEFTNVDGKQHEKVLLYKAELDQALDVTPESALNISDLPGLRHYLDGARDLVNGVLSKIQKPAATQIADVTVARYPQPLTPQAIGTGGTDNSSIPATARLQENHPPSREVTAPTASAPGQVAKRDIPPEGSHVLRKTDDGKDYPPLAKEVGDAPGLRHSTPGSLERCDNCKYVRFLGQVYCRAHDFPTAYDWYCKTFTLQDGTGEPDALAESPSSISKDAPAAAPSQAAAPASLPVELAKTEAKCPSCGSAISLEKEGSFTCASCGKAYKCSMKMGALHAEPDDATVAKGGEIHDEAWFVKNLVSVTGIAEKDFKYAPLPDAAKSYPADRTQYADPVNWSWPVDTALRANVMLIKFNEGSQKSAYSEAEWHILGRYLRRMASEKTGIVYKYDPRERKILVDAQIQPVTQEVTHV